MSENDTLVVEAGAVPQASGEAAGHAPKGNKKRQKRDVHGWIVLDKPIGMTSTHAVAVIKNLFGAKRAGHAGTLDPLASGCLPIVPRNRLPCVGKEEIHHARLDTDLVAHNRQHLFDALAKPGSGHTRYSAVNDSSR